MGTDRRTFLSSMAAGLAGAALAQATGRAWAQATKIKPGPRTCSSSSTSRTTSSRAGRSR